MRRTFLTLVAAALMVLSVSTARAALILSVEPSTGKIKVGQQVDVDLRISGLGSGAAPSLGAFDLGLTFNHFVLNFNGLSFGDPVLGDQLDLFGFGLPGFTTGVTTPAINAVRLFEFSFDPPSALDTLQANSFVLATLSFTGVSSGLSNLMMPLQILGDSLGNPLTASVSPGLVRVPEPTTLTLLVIGLAGLGFIMRRRRTNA